MADGIFNINFCCPLCGRLHAIRQCTRFMVMDVNEKLRVVAQHALCYNCLAQSHTRNKCISIDRCYRCGEKHHSCLHPLPRNRIWFPMTAYLRVFTRQGGREKWTIAIIDPNATKSSITLEEALELGCKIVGNQTTLTITHSHRSGRRILADFTVEHKSYGFSPKTDIHRPEEHPRSESNDLANACKYWHSSTEIYMIIGADLISKVLIGPAKGRPGHVYAQNTIFGVAFFGEGIKS